jgi:hypothetical protein
MSKIRLRTFVSVLVGPKSSSTSIEILVTVHDIGKWGFTILTTVRVLICVLPQVPPPVRLASLQ